LFRDELKRKSAKLWKSVKLGLDHNEFEELIKDMAQENLQLEILTRGNLELEPLRRERSRDMDTGYWKAIRDLATRLYDCLICRWPCQCGFTHRASLRLDIKESAGKGDRFDVKFGVVFAFSDEETILPSLPWNWRNTEIRTVKVLNE
jgi:hypothetical protein